MINLIIDNKNITAGDGTTLLDAARQAGIDIPTLCHYKNIAPSASCFVCAVKIDGRENFVPACATAAVDGMVVDTCSEEVTNCRRLAIELLLSVHDGRCPQCGEKRETCKLRTYAARYGARWTRFDSERREVHKRRVYDSGLIHEPGKCIVCGICVGITRTKNIKSGLTFCGRGADVYVSAPFDADIDTAMGEALCECAKACPAGALRIARGGNE